MELTSCFLFIMYFIFILLSFIIMNKPVHRYCVVVGPKSSLIDVNKHDLTDKKIELDY